MRLLRLLSLLQVLCLLLGRLSPAATPAQRTVMFSAGSTNCPKRVVCSLGGPSSDATRTRVNARQVSGGGTFVSAQPPLDHG